MSVLTRLMITPMNTAESTMVTKQPRALSGILWAGVVSGALDITAALIVYARFGAFSVRLLQGIASGLLGKDAFQGGLATAFLGLLCHFFIATSAAAVYYVASRRMAILVQHAVLSGASYGVGVYGLMQLVVIPLSASAPRPFSVHATIAG